MSKWRRKRKAFELVDTSRIHTRHASMIAKAKI